MPSTCEHLPADLTAPAATGSGCLDCVELGRNDWVHLRLCWQCGHVGCCDNSPLRHATAHYHDSSHPLIRSYEPREEWWWCYADEDFLFNVPGAPPAPSHP